MASLIGNTLQDIFAQDFGNYEIIVSDNQSTDNIDAVIERFNDKRLRYFKNERNVGYFKNLELCLQRATGDVIYLMSAKSRLAKDALVSAF